MSFGCIEAASNALVLHRGSAPFGRAVYRVLNRWTPANYVEDTLGVDALDRGDTDAAYHYAASMTASSRRDDLLARVAQARNQTKLAYEYFFVADDIDNVQRAIEAMTVHDIPGAIVAERRFAAKLQADGTHPDAVAQAYAHEGEMEAQLGRNADALASYQRASSLAPLNQTYALFVANQYLSVRDNVLAKQWYERTRRIDPQSADALAGLGVIALRDGDRASAQRYEAQARASDPRAGMLVELERELK